MPQKQTQSPRKLIPYDPNQRNMVIGIIQEHRLEALKEWCAKNDPNAQIEIKATKEHCTLLHLAAYYGWKEGIDYLLENTTDLNPYDFKNDTPIDIAINQGNYEIEAFLSTKIAEKHDNQQLKHYIDQKKWKVAQALFNAMRSENKRLTLSKDGLNKFLVHAISIEDWELAESCFIEMYHNQKRLDILEGFSNPLLKYFIREEKWQLADALFIEMYSKRHALTILEKYINQFLYYTSINHRELTKVLLGEMHKQRYPITIPQDRANQLLEDCIKTKKWELAQYLLREMYARKYPITIPDRAHNKFYEYADKHHKQKILDILLPPSNSTRHSRPSTTDERENRYNFYSSTHSEWSQEQTIKITVSL